MKSRTRGFLLTWTLVSEEKGRARGPTPGSRPAQTRPATSRQSPAVVAGRSRHSFTENETLRPFHNEQGALLSHRSIRSEIMRREDPSKATAGSTTAGYTQIDN